MPTLRQRKQYEAEILSLSGSVLTRCYVLAEVETTMDGSMRVESWSGKFTSLSNPAGTYEGRYLLRPLDATESNEILVLEGAIDRRGLTSDEYWFRGEDCPPKLP